MSFDRQVGGFCRTLDMVSVVPLPTRDSLHTEVGDLWSGSENPPRLGDGEFPGRRRCGLQSSELRCDWAGPTCSIWIHRDSSKSHERSWRFPRDRIWTYTNLERIAVGGMAEVFRAIQHGECGFRRDMVLKRILPAMAADPKFQNAFLDEAHIAMTFHRGNIVPC